jgi:hypothetical protein
MCGFLWATLFFFIGIAFWCCGVRNQAQTNAPPVSPSGKERPLQSTFETLRIVVVLGEAHNKTVKGAGDDVVRNAGARELEGRAQSAGATVGGASTVGRAA